MKYLLLAGLFFIVGCENKKPEFDGKCLKSPIVSGIFKVIYCTKQVCELQGFQEDFSRAESKTDLRQFWTETECPKVEK